MEDLPEVEQLTEVIRTDDGDGLKALIAAGEVSIEDDGVNILLQAADIGSVKVIDALWSSGFRDINAQDHAGFTALIYASENGYFNAVSALIDYRADVNLFNNYGETALMGVCTMALGVYLDNKDQYDNIAELLLDADADPDVTGENAKSFPLFAASAINKPDIVKLLLDNGADVNKQTADKQTSLHGAAIKGNVDIVRMLLEKGADKTIIDKDGHTAYEVASTEEIKALIGAPALFTGTPAGEINYFDVFLGKAESEEEVHANIKKHTFCPVCLGHSEREGDCLYITHKCPEDKRHSDLYNKYKNGAGEISWCTECGRCAKDSKHYKFDLVMRAVPDLLPSGATCEASGGGGVHEKMQRVVRYVDYLYDLEHAVGEISEDSARKELIEEVWNGPARRVRFDPSKYKKFKTDTTVFKAGGVRVVGMYEMTGEQCVVEKKAGKRRTLKIKHRKNK